MILYQEEKHSDEEIYKMLNPLVAEWFRKKFVNLKRISYFSLFND